LFRGPAERVCVLVDWSLGNTMSARGGMCDLTRRMFRVQVGHLENFASEMELFHPVPLETVNQPRNKKNTFSGAPSILFLAPSSFSKSKIDSKPQAPGSGRHCKFKERLTGARSRPQPWLMTTLAPSLPSTPLSLSLPFGLRSRPFFLVNKPSIPGERSARFASSRCPSTMPAL
jgi:hypothetical protein